MAQQANPNVAPHVEDLRAQLMTRSTEVSRIPAGSFSSSPMSVPVQSAAAPHVGVRDEHGANEQNHLDESEQPQVHERDRPRVQEDDLDVEDDEQHGGQVELDREPAAAHRLGRRLDAALVRLELGPVVPLRADQLGDADGKQRERRRQGEQRQYGYVRGERHVPSYVRQSAGTALVIALMTRSMASPPRAS